MGGLGRKPWAVLLIFSACLPAATGQSRVEVLSARLTSQPDLGAAFRASDWSMPLRERKTDCRLAYNDRSFFLDVQSPYVLPPRFTVEVFGNGVTHTVRLSRQSKEFSPRESLVGEPSPRTANLHIGADSETAEMHRLTFEVPWARVGVSPGEGRVEVFVHESGGPSAKFSCAAISDGKKAEDDLVLSPFALGSANTDTSGFGNLGLDYKTAFGGRTLLGSISPDFRTVERAILNLDFSYIERLAPETRPFFLDGENYLDPTFLATQRIGTFNAGEKLYGKLDPSTTFGLLDTANFWDENEVAAGLTRNLGQNASVSAGFKDLHDLLVNNQYSAGSFSMRNGPFSVRSDVQVTDDAQTGGGSSTDLNLAYRKNGSFVSLAAVDTTADFFDRLGYYTQPDIRGAEVSMGAGKAYRKGALSDSGFDLVTLQFQSQNGALFQNYVGGGGTLDFRNGIRLDANYQSGRYQTNRDRYGYASLSGPVLGGKGQLGVEVTAGILDSANYLNILPYFSYALGKKLEVSGYFQAVRQFGHETQTIVGFRYDLGRGQSLSGRATEFQDAWNAYLRYHRDVSKNFIYEVIVGDPNAIQFQRAIWLKLIFPMDIKY